jgi:AraC family transcriptional regulator
MQQTHAIGRLSSASRTHLNLSWAGGGFQIASREGVPHVDGWLRSDYHLIMVTLRGGARRHVWQTADGLRYDGPDRPGMVSFLPAGCQRRLELTDVDWTWGAFRIAAEETPPGLRSLHLPADRFLAALFAEMEALAARDGAMDTGFASAMAAAAWRYLGARHFLSTDDDRAEVLPAWRLRRLRETVADRLSEPLSVADLAAGVGLSERQLYRALRATTGQTPLGLITALRLDRARDLLQRTDAPIPEIARVAGFASPSHFARLFRRATGQPPSDWRRARQ